jgi:hypothetical protein
MTGNTGLTARQLDKITRITPIILADQDDEVDGTDTRRSSIAVPATASRGS